ncbi:hypothetical protein F3Y22_tig00110387pilonHSYRG00591 [Hibiscus syriacus]|uniref:Uncharacterized protein n=1 Tax=Hibiscus syriacus TaxID=106335 RepID=A0A6A3AQN9_HIBSY|nr:hypothetical protein F3Y22_tig00110387pilonHSYRG00591 [Hibiscus syriacus]
MVPQNSGSDLTASSLRLDSSGGDDVDKLIINEIFEVALNEIKSSPLILFVKDIEKSIAGNTDIYTALKSKLENLPTNIVVIGSHTQMDNHKEKSHPGSLLFPKFGSNQTVLLDLAFPRSPSNNTPDVSLPVQDNLVDFMKGDEALLLDWKQQLERDIETLKEQANFVSIRSLLSQSKLPESDLFYCPCVGDKLIGSISVHKNIGILDFEASNLFYHGGFGRVWNHGLLANIIEEEVYVLVIDEIITFDSYGVSGHCNHGDVHRGVV